MSGDNTLSYLDEYCERTGDAGLWAEPFNAITNIAFLIAACLAWRAWRAGGSKPWLQSLDIILLVLLLCAIGVGSSLWHLFASKHTLLMDVIPIVVFMNIFLISAAIRLMGLKWWGAFLFFALFQALNIASEMYLPRDFLNGTIMYLPAYGLLLVMVIWVNKRKAAGRHLLMQALVLWSLSLAFRTIDNDVCPQLPIGTHFLWHMFNALVLYRLLGALIMAQAMTLSTASRK